MEERVSSINNPFSKFVVEATGYDSSTRQFRTKGLVYLHDPLAVGVAVDPDLVKREKISLRVETQQGEDCGKIKEGYGGPKIDVCLEVDPMRFLDLFLSRLG